MSFKYDVDLGEVDLSANFDHGNPETARLLASRYGTEVENVFVSSEGASGQNARIIRYLAERDPKRTEAVVEYPTYEPLLRQAQEHFGRVRRLERKEKERCKLDATSLRKLVSEKTGLLLITNPHAPSGSVADMGELKEIMAVAREFDFFVVCDEIYAEFNRSAVPTLFSVDSEYGVVTTSFTKAYGLGGLKLGVALAQKRLVDELYADVLNTVGNSPNLVQMLASEILAKGMEALERHKRRWEPIKLEAERWLDEKGIEYFPDQLGVTYWVKLPIRDTYSWVNEHAIPDFNVAVVPGAFFLFKNDYEIVRSDRVRIGLGNVVPDKSDLPEALESVEKSLKAYGSVV
jgi:aspartate/methionine/tyrosine aminotransferase